MLKFSWNNLATAVKAAVDLIFAVYVLPKLTNQLSNVGRLNLKMTKLFLKHQTSMPVAILTLFLLMVFAAVAVGKSESVIAVENGGKLVESVGNLPDWPEEDWNGANDGDVSTWGGTVTVFNKPPEGDAHPWAIFAVKDEKTVWISKARFYMINQVVIDCCPNRCGKDFLIEVSTTTTDEGVFKIAHKGTTQKVEKEWEEIEFKGVRAKYVKLTWESNYGDGTYTTLAEFEVIGGAGAAVQPSVKLATVLGKIKSETQ